MLTLQKLESEKTRVVSLKSIMKNESTTFNNIKIIENIYMRQFDLKVNDLIFHHVLQLIYENLKTWSCICFVKKLRCDISKQSFNHFDWLLSELDLWHFRLNMLQLIHKIHWDDIESSDVSTLQYTTDKWHWACVIQLNDFQTLEELIIHSYQVWMMSMWVRHLQCEKLDHRRIEETLLWLSTQTMNKSDSWLQVLNSISDRIHWFSLMTKVVVESSACDEHFNNHQNYCAHVETYLILQYAIKYANIDLLCYALRHMTVMFQTETAETLKYEQTLLYILYLIDSAIMMTRLQECMLINSLMNLQDVEDFNFELNRLLELLNNNLKTFQRKRSSFTKNSDQMLENWALNESYLLKLKSVMKSCFERLQAEKHASKFAVEDIWSMMLNLAFTSLRRSSQDRFSLHSTVNLYIARLERLDENILKYNQQHDVKVISFDIIDDDAEAAINFIDSIINTSNSLTISTNLLETCNYLFVDWNLRAQNQQINIARF